MINYSFEIQANLSNRLKCVLENFWCNLLESHLLRSESYCVRWDCSQVNVHRIIINKETNILLSLSRSSNFSPYAEACVIAVTQTFCFRHMSSLWEIKNQKANSKIKQSKYILHLKEKHKIHTV